MNTANNQSHVFATARAFDVEAGFLRNGSEMQCYVVTVGGISKPTDTLEQARAFVRWHETQEGEIGEHEQYSIVRVTWSADALALERGGFVHDTGVQTVEQVESGVVYYAAEAAQEESIMSTKYVAKVDGIYHEQFSSLRAARAWVRECYGCGMRRGERRRYTIEIVGGGDSYGPALADYGFVMNGRLYAAK